MNYVHREVMREASQQCLPVKYMIVVSNSPWQAAYNICSYWPVQQLYILVPNRYRLWWYRIRTKFSSMHVWRSRIVWCCGLQDLEHCQHQADALYIDTHTGTRRYTPYMTKDARVCIPGDERVVCTPMGQSDPDTDIDI